MGKATKSYHKWCKKNWMCVSDAKDAIHIWKSAWKRGVKAERKRCAALCDQAASHAWPLWEKTADQLDQGRALQAEDLANALRKSILPRPEQPKS